jgi:hypothetical protein
LINILSRYIEIGIDGRSNPWNPQVVVARLAKSIDAERAIDRFEGRAAVVRGMVVPAA